MAETTSLGLHNLPAPKGATKDPKRKGRGRGTGLGKTSGRGHKGQRSRSSGNVRPGFEGGQMPLIRRVPKRGFTNPFRVPNQAVNIRDLGELAGEEVTPLSLLEAGLISTVKRPVKLLGTGEVDRSYVVKGCLTSKTARSKIEQAGGHIED